MLNNLTLVGRLTKPVEIRKDKKGESISTFTLAFNSGKEEANFIDCVAFGKQVDNLSQFCKKGDLLGVTGSLRQRKYTRKDGSQTSTIEILVNGVEFLQPKEKEPAEPNPKEFVTEEIPEGYIKGEDGKLYKAVDKA